MVEISRVQPDAIAGDVYLGVMDVVEAHMSDMKILDGVGQKRERTRQEL